MMSSISRRLRFLANSFSNPKNSRKDLTDSKTSHLNPKDVESTITSGSFLSASPIVDLSYYASPANAMSSMVDPRTFNITSFPAEDSSSCSNSHLECKSTNVKSYKNSSTLEASIPIHLSRIIAEIDSLSGR